MPKPKTIILNFKTSDGKTLSAEFELSDGESAFELWKKLPGNEAKNETQYFAEQKGAQGVKGDKGDKGDRGAQGEKGITGTTGAQGASIVSVSVQVKENP
ncbi:MULTISPECIES: collagen-like protein [Providencia]|uniref:collagen-like protein n=1 Tax=Providencia TaxID=586 RepID=UPI001B3758FD|nr:MULTISPECIES: collagen-like protein [Providencia]MBQ0531883.1 collagen-like protein [Providencia rettgeri]WOB85496.1 collagen-like protein [Providencia sp. PROV040]